MYASTDGTGSAARFNAPYGLAVDSCGNVYVADTYNYAIRKVTAAGAVTTRVGSASTIGGVPGPLPATLSLPRGIAFTPAGDLVVPAPIAWCKSRPSEARPDFAPLLPTRNNLKAFLSKPQPNTD